MGSLHGRRGTGIVGDDAKAWLISVVGASILFTTVLEWILRVLLGDGIQPAILVAQLLLTVLPGIAIAFAGYWLRRSDLTPARYGRVAAWCVGGLVTSVVTNVVIMAAVPPDDFEMLIGWLRTAATFGATAGTAVGIVEGRAIERHIAAARERSRAAAAERETERLAYLNTVLRHDILNATNVIHGFTSWVLDERDLDPDARDRLGSVREQALRMAETVNDVRTLIDAARDDDMSEPVELVAVLEAQAAALRERYDGVTVDIVGSPEATVRTDGFVVHVFRNLLENAVVHNDDQPHVTVRVERAEDSVVVTVTDDGTGVPPEERETMFDRSAKLSHGLGLSLVAELLERYDGNIELTDTGPDGSTFTVEMPRADGPPAE